MTPADTVYRAELDAPTGSRKTWSRLLWPVRLVAAGLGVVDEVMLGEVVVRRLDDDVEVLRIPVSGTEETGQQLTSIRTELAEMSVEDFDAAWGITPS